MRIDAHNHFWKYTEAEYGWISKEMNRLRGNFLPSELRMELDDLDIDGVISVQARQTIEETGWLLEMAGKNPFIKGVVGWVPLKSSEAGAVLEAFAGVEKLRGVRHVLHDEKDDHYMLRPAFNRGIALLKQFGLVYDILVLERHLPQTIEFVDMHPEQPFVLDHLGKPLIASGEMEPWATNIAELAKRQNVSCKISGMVTEADWNMWDSDTLAPYFDTAMEAFGVERVMFGSDWPVCLLAAEYKEWVERAEDLASGLAENEFKALFGNNAARIYGLK